MIRFASQKLTTLLFVFSSLIGFARADVIIYLDGSTDSGKILHCDSTHILFRSGLSANASPASIRLDLLDPHFHYSIRSRYMDRSEPSNRLSLVRLCHSLRLSRLALFEWELAWSSSDSSNHHSLRSALRSLLPSLEASHAHSLYLEGLSRRSQGKWSEAMELHRKVLESYPDSPTAPLSSTEWADLLDRQTSAQKTKALRLDRKQARNASIWDRAIRRANSTLEDAREKFDVGMTYPAGSSRAKRLLSAWNLLRTRALPQVDYLKKRIQRDINTLPSPTTVPERIRTFGNDIRSEQVKIALEMSRIYYLRRRFQDSKRWAIRALALDPENAEATSLRANRPFSDNVFDPFEIPKEALIRTASRRSHIDSFTARVLERRLTSEQIESVNSARESAGLDPIPDS